jgi:hypothetical protein
MALKPQKPPVDPASIRARDEGIHFVQKGTRSARPTSVAHQASTHGGEWVDRGLTGVDPAELEFDDVKGHLLTSGGHPCIDCL